MAFTRKQVAYEGRLDQVLQHVSISDSGCWLWTAALNDGGLSR